MLQNTKYVSGALLTVIIIGLIAFYFGKNPATDLEIDTKNNPPITSTTSTPTKPVTTTPGTSVKPVVKKGFYSYANAEYNFTIQYPSYIQPRNSFSSFHEISNAWRLYPAQANQGKGILELPIFSLDQGSISNGKQKYPLFFIAEVRVGISPNVKECYATDAGYSSQKITNVTINGVTFKRFYTADGAMMKYVQAESYRTIHNGQCFVLEQIKNGSNYRDEKMTAGISDATLNGYYNVGEVIIGTFKFTK